jgi:hypothetical protein
MSAAVLLAMCTAGALLYHSHLDAGSQSGRTPGSDMTNPTASSGSSQPDVARSGTGVASTVSSFASPNGSDISDESPETKPLESSAEQEARTRQMVRAVTRWIYEDIAVAAGLSVAEAEVLLELLASQQMELVASSFDPMTVAGAYELNRLQDRHRNEVVAQLGSARAAAVANYQKSINARFEVEELRRQLEAAGEPITDAQRRSLIDAAIEKGAYVDLPTFSGGDSESAMLQELLARIQQRDHRLLQIAQSVLSASQSRIYDEYLQRRHAELESHLPE